MAKGVVIKTAGTKYGKTKIGKTPGQLGRLVGSDATDGTFDNGVRIHKKGRR